MNFLNKYVLLAQSQNPTCPPGEFCNPLGGTGTFDELLLRVTGQLAYIAIPVLALMILWGGFQMMTSEGQAEKFNKGKKTIMYAIVGFIILILGGGVGYIIREVFTVTP